MNTTRRNFIALSLGLTALFATGCSNRKPDLTVLKIGYFPNITHAQALVGLNETNTKGAEGWFEKRTGVKIEWYPFNAGPAAMEALQSGSIDATYVGPNPPLNCYIRAKGKEIRILTGSARGGVAFVVQPGAGLKTPADFRGKRIATPQLGNTQDVAARTWLKNGGLNITTSGGDANVIPAANPDQLSLFQTKDIAGAWTVEPWVSRLELEAHGEVLVSQNDAVITVIATSDDALASKRELLKKFVAAHEELTAKVVAEPNFAKTAVSAAFEKATSRPIPAKLLDHAWPRLKFTTEINRAEFDSLMKDAKSVGLLQETADLSSFFVKP